MNTKQFYEAPEAELLVVNYEENILSDPQQTYSSQSITKAVEDDDWGTF